MSRGRIACCIRQLCDAVWSMLRTAERMRITRDACRSTLGGHAARDVAISSGPYRLCSLGCPPILCKEISCFQWVTGGRGANFFLSLDLAAECSSQRTYGLSLPGDSRARSFEFNDRGLAGNDLQNVVAGQIPNRERDTGKS